jgi:hypothetical protein
VSFRGCVVAGITIASFGENMNRFKKPDSGVR